MMNPPFLTPLWAIRRLEASQSVPLDAPGWGDTRRINCPECHQPVMTVRSRDHILFEYGVGHAHPHRCGQPVPWEDHPHWLRLEAINKELDELRQARLEERQAGWLP